MSMADEEEEEEDYGFGSEDEPSSDMEVDDSAEYGFDPAEDIDISSRRVRLSHSVSCLGGHAASQHGFSGSMQQFWLDVAAIGSCKRHHRLCMTCMFWRCHLWEINTVALTP
jgi:hypothetical protein